MYGSFRVIFLVFFWEEHFWDFLKRLAPGVGKKTLCWERAVRAAKIFQSLALNWKKRRWFRPGLKRRDTSRWQARSSVCGGMTSSQSVDPKYFLFPRQGQISFGQNVKYTLSQIFSLASIWGRRWFSPLVLLFSAPSCRGTLTTTLCSTSKVLRSYLLETSNFSFQMSSWATSS